jgi:hypothetical protein
MSGPLTPSARGVTSIAQIDDGLRRLGLGASAYVLLTSAISDVHGTTQSWRAVSGSEPPPPPPPGLLDAILSDPSLMAIAMACAGVGGFALLLLLLCPLCGRPSLAASCLALLWDCCPTRASTSADDADDATKKKRGRRRRRGGIDSAAISDLEIGSDLAPAALAEMAAATDDFEEDESDDESFDDALDWRWDVEEGRDARSRQRAVARCESPLTGAFSPDGGPREVRVQLLQRSTCPVPLS